MARGWRVLDATSFTGRIGTRRGQLIFQPEDGAEQAIPASDIAVLLIGTDTTISSGTLHYLGTYDVVALACDWRGVPISGFFPWLDHTRVGARHLAQATLTQPRRKNAWMQIVKAKIRGQAATLEIFDDLAGAHLRDIANSVRSGDTTNAEAVAARWYWRHLFQFADYVRDPNGTDLTNSLLNYGYGVLHGFGIRAVISAGLSPTLGLFHRNRSNFFNLVEDVIEPFRPAVDAAVASMPTDADLCDPDVKHSMVAAASQPFTPSRRGISAEMDDLAQQLGKYVEGEVDRLTVATWNGPIAREPYVSGE